MMFKVIPSKAEFPLIPGQVPGLSLEGYRVLTAVLPHILWTARPDGTIAYCSPYWFTYTGLSEDESHGTGYVETIHPDHRARVGAAWIQSLTTGEPYEQEIPFRRHDGVYRWFLSRALPVRDASGHVTEWVGTGIDIHERKEMTETLRLVTETMPQLVWSTRPDGYHDYYNQRWYDYTGLTYEETKGKGWSHLLHPDDVERTWAAWQHSLKTGEPYEIEYRFQRYDGVYRWFIGRALPLKDDYGNVLRWFGTCTDIDDQKQQAEELTRSHHEIAVLNEQLQRSMTETHHRVKNNLQIISALIDMQAMEHHSDEEIAAEFRRLNSHVRTMAAVHDVLTHRARQDGKAHRVSARFVLEKMLPMLQAMAGQRKIHHQIDDTEMPGKQGTSLALITNELVLNALKHGTGDIVVLFRVEENTATLEVIDDGPGFPPDFDPIISGNTGIRLIESVGRWDLGGDIEYKNRLDVSGAIVTVTLSLTQLQDAIQPEMRTP